MRQRLCVVIAFIAAVLSLGTSAASAQTATVHPDFTCPSRTVCLFPNDNLTGNYPAWGGPATLATDAFNGSWMTFGSVGADDPNPGSLNDNSNSAIWVFSHAMGNRKWCIITGTANLTNSYGWFMIQFGATTCQNVPVDPVPAT